MGRLIFVLKAEGSLLFGTDAPIGGGGPENGTITVLADKLVGVVHTDNEPIEFGPILLAHLAKNSPSFTGDLFAYAKAAAPILAEFCSSKAAPQTGVIFGGIRRVGTAERAQVVGVHVQRGFAPLEFPVSVFGGPVNAIARYLDQKVAYGLTVDLPLAKELAVWYISQTRLALGNLIEDSCCLASLSVSKGLSWASPDEIEALSSKNSVAFPRLRVTSMSLFGRSTE